jgi:2'-5' RNA ligase
MGIRSFVAIECNDVNIVSNVSRVQRSLSSAKADVKFVEPENIHLTLKFLGDVQEELIDNVIDVVKEVSFEPFNFTIEGVGVFPSLRRPQTIWAGITNGLTDLSQVFNLVEDGLSKLGFEKERRRFNPHLTLGRVRSGRNRDKLVEALKAHADEKFGEVRVDKITLKKSVLTPKGPIYTNLAESG